MGYVFGPRVKMVEVASYNARNYDDVHGLFFVITMSYALNKGVFSLHKMFSVQEFSLKMDFL